MIDSDTLDSQDGYQAEEELAQTSPSLMKQKKLELLQNRMARENRRIRNSASFRFGKLFTRAATRPWLLIVLPFSVLYLLFSIGMERLGRWPAPVDEKEEKILQHDEINDCVMFFPTNGVGFGHFTRMYALARRFKKYSPSTEIVFFTTMPTLHLLYNEGFVTYHIAGRKKFADISAGEWNALVEEHLSLAFEQHKPSMFIFDGAFPYRGMLNAIRGQKATRKIWMRRGTFKKGSSIPVDSIAHFDTIVHPEDSVPLAPNEFEHGVESLTCAPIVLLDEDDLLPRNAARNRLNLPQEGRVVYVQLGAGRINEIDSEIRITVEALLKHDDVTVVLGESMLGERIDINLDRVVLLRDYPNSMYFNAFDATVQAGGYNSFHETRRFGLPALFYPNMQTGMDDQLARCKVAEQEGWGHVVEKRNQLSISEGIEKLFSIENNSYHDGSPNGAVEIYTELTGHNPKGFNEGWIMPKAAIDWIEHNVAKGADILEFGSGDGSENLARQYNLYSIEHDAEYIGKTTTKYIHAPIIENKISTQNGEKGWYDPAFFDQIPQSFELIIVDGPPGLIGRMGLLEYLNLMPTWTYMLVDDTDREKEQKLVDELCKHFTCSSTRMKTDQYKANGDIRMFDILERR
jgi:UDP-N-acetylglucosamine--N-acetylmuramyl-(pentapeptide) pyrophosphoryl-undecaprenol N-acetylglucosamine transferase